MSIVSTLCPSRGRKHRCESNWLPGRQRGAVAIIAAVFLLAMIGIAAFAIDIGRWFVVKNELQNAADAAALAGAGYIYPPLPTGPNWGASKSEGEEAVGLNASDTEKLESGIVVPGYWDFSNQTFDLNTAKTPGANDLPALRVTIDRTDGQNMGPVAMTFGRIFGTETMNASATATAVVAVPGEAGPGTLAPLAISGCIFADADPPLWDPVANAPVGNPPQKFIIASGAASGKACNGCACGQWTTFDEEDPSVTAVRDLITGGNTDTVTTGSSGQVEVTGTYIQPGTEANLWYHNNHPSARNWVGQDIRVVVVDKDYELENKGQADVTGFACLHVYKAVSGDNCTHYEGEGPLPGAVDAKNGKGNCVIVSFSNSPSCRMPGGGMGGPGPYTGVSLPPRLVQ